MRAAASLLSAATSTTGLADLVIQAGITERCVPLEPGELPQLSIEQLRDVRLGASSGACRVLIGAVEAEGHASLRDVVQRLARRLSARTPHILWLLALVDQRTGQAALVAWTPTPSGAPRVAAFRWEPERVVDSDAETLRALSAGSAGHESLRHAHWLEVLGRDAMTRRFFRVLDGRVGSLAASLPRMVLADDAREVALLYVTRLLFLHFLQAKGWLDGQPSFLADRLDECLVGGGRFHQRVLLPLFFGTLNTPTPRRSPAARAFGRVPFLNGGLFTRTAVERRMGRHRFDDAQFAALFDELFLRYRFVAREDSATWSEASVDPEMLGRAFESLMASPERKAGGVYYTPHELVERVTGHALDSVDVRNGLAEVTVLDPACGSGAFLVHALERLAALRSDAEAFTIPELRREVLVRSIFGIDRSPTAVWLCQLRLWLSVVIESDLSDPHGIVPLPNLDRNVRVGDALAGAAFSRDQQVIVGGARLAALRQRYSRATGARKETLARALDREERRRVLAGLDRDIATVRRGRAELVSLERTRDLFGQRRPRDAESRRQRRTLRDRLRRLRQERRVVADGGALPLSFGAFFGDVQSAGGFHVVIGNPPWVRLHNIPSPLRLRLRESFQVFSAASWTPGATAANASKGFASQVDLSALFVERSVSLLRDGGALGLLLPSKLWRSLAGGGARRFLLRRTQLTVIEDLGDSRSSFEAAVYPSIISARKSEDERSSIRVTVGRRDGRMEWRVRRRELPFDESEGAPWLLLPTDARLAFERIRAAGPPLTSQLGAPRLGVKSGCNCAFVVRVERVARGLASILDANGERGCVEESLLRPALRGDSVVRWRRGPADEHLIWTHDERGALANLPPRAREWLGRSYSELTLRSDARGVGRWWSLFRTEAGDSTKPRVVWSDFGKAPRALVLPGGDPAVPLNSCYVVSCRNAVQADTLCAILNSTMVAAWINSLAEPARGGYRRYLGWTMGLLPLPGDWDRAVSLLGDEAIRTLKPEALNALVLRAYDLRVRDVSALLEWERCG